jgi:ribosomal protein S18 acetylase RimI-like enzyme
VPGNAATMRIGLRTATTDDREFLLALYGTTRADLALLPLDDEQRGVLVEMQFNAQDLHYRQHHPDAAFDVVEVGGRPVGRFYVDRAAADIRIIDVTLLPEHRGAGIGGSLIRAVQDEAAADGRTVVLHVALDNPAARLYDRLGFRLAEDLGVYRRLEWSRS